MMIIRHYTYYIMPYQVRPNNKFNTYYISLSGKAYQQI